MRATTRESAAPTAAGLAYARLRGDILRGILVPRERLRVNEVSERYGCGAIPTREALNRLAAEHLVVHSAQRGFAVAPISARDLRDLTRARSMLVEAAMRGDIRLEPFVTHTLPLDRINEAFDLMHEGKSIRTVIRY